MLILKVTKSKTLHSLHAVYFLKYIFGNTPDIFFLVFDDVPHVHQNFGIRDHVRRFYGNNRTLCTCLI